MDTIIMRGTTPEHRFRLPFEADIWDTIFITYSQDYKTVFEKDISSCTIGDHMISVTLTQKETLLLQRDRPTEIQMALKSGDRVVRSRIKRVETYRVLKDGEI